LPRDFVECPEIVGKTIQAVKLHDDPDEGCEAVFEFTDGTSFSCCMECRSSMKSILFREGDGTPKVIREYGT
jgi:hypothetical protein